MKNYILISSLSVLLGFFSTLNAQQLLFGNVTSQGEPVEFCSVAILSSDSTVIDGILTDSLGDFELKPRSFPVILRVSAIGYEKQFIPISSSSKEAYKITLKRELTEFDEVVVQGEVSEMIFKLDKRVFNVGKDLSNSGGSALEVLNNVPSVEVTLEGAVKLRGSSGVQILINGKPSVVAESSGTGLGSITADMIEKIEIITNPSAKYDASGTTGIINIVLKKNAKKGFNGAVTINTGYPNNHSLGLSLNYRSKAVNLFGQFGVGYRTFVSERIGHNNDLTQSKKLSWDGDSEKNELFVNARIGANFYLNKYNTITISGNWARENETEFATWNYQLDEPLNNNYSVFSRKESTKAINPKWQFDLSHELQFKNKKEHKLNTSFVGSYFAKDKNSEFLNEVTSGTMSTNDQRSDSRFAFSNYSFQSDYTLPIDTGMTFEAGIKADIDNNTNKMDVFKNVANNWEIDTAYSNNFRFSINVISAYATFAKEWKKLGIKGGVRYEHTLSNIKNEGVMGNTWDYFNFFPSFHTSYKFTPKTSVQLGYSRRIKRPNMWDLNPFISFRDNFNLSTGNPLLQPEFSNVVELTAIQNWKKHNLNGSIFYRHTTDVIEDIKRVENNVSISTVDNIGTSSLLGIELNYKVQIAKWFSIHSEGNFTYFQRFGQFESQKFDFENVVGSIRSTAKFKLKKGFEAQVSGRYISPRQNVFFKEGQVYYFDLGLKQKILKGKGVVNLSVRDVFASRMSISSINRDDLSYYSRSKRGRYIVIGFSYGFGKGETMHYGGFKRF